jgi:glycosyltransferase involved in cell wall biosynthesis
MAAALPVIISPNVGAKDLIEEGVNGFVVDREDVDAVSRRILLMLDRGKRIEMGINAHRTAQDHSWDIMAHNVMGLYEKILSGKSC